MADPAVPVSRTGPGAVPVGPAVDHAAHSTVAVPVPDATATDDRLVSGAHPGHSGPACGKPPGRSTPCTGIDSGGRTHADTGGAYVTVGARAVSHTAASDHAGTRTSDTAAAPP